MSMSQHADSSADDPVVDGMQRYRKALVRLVARIVKPHDIEDIVQETCLRVYQAAQKQPIYHLKSFMLQSARNIALNHATRADAMNHLAALPSEQELDDEADAWLTESSWGPSTESLAQSQEEFLLFCRAIRELPLQCRRAFILKKVHGMSQKEVARQLGISESTVEQHIAKGMLGCRNYMIQHGMLQHGISKQSHANNAAPHRPEPDDRRVV